LIPVQLGLQSPSPGLTISNSHHPSAQAINGKTEIKAKNKIPPKITITKSHLKTNSIIFEYKGVLGSSTLRAYAYF